MTSCVYLIAADNGWLKIGKANRPTERMKTLAVGLPYNLRLVRTWHHSDAYVVEKAAHKALALHCVRGEWFAVSIEDAVAAIEAAIAKIENAPEPEIANSVAAQWVLANTAWNIERQRRVALLRQSGREMTREEQRAWLDAGGMADYPPPARPWVTQAH